MHPLSRTCFNAALRSVIKCSYAYSRSVLCTSRMELLHLEAELLLVALPLVSAKYEFVGILKVLSIGCDMLHVFVLPPTNKSGIEGTASAAPYPTPMCTPPHLRKDLSLERSTDRRGVLFNYGSKNTDS